MYIDKIERLSLWLYSIGITFVWIGDHFAPIDVNGMVHDNPLFLLGGAAIMILGAIGLIGALIVKLLNLTYFHFSQNDANK